MRSAAVLKRPQSDVSILPELVDRIQANAARGEEYQKEVGKDLIQAKELVAKGEWHMWLEENFDWSTSTANRYMNLAKGRRRIADKDQPRKKLHRDTSKIAGSVNYNALRKEYEDKEKERQLMRTLSHKLIDIGYRVLAVKLHPDKPTGSEEGMARLNSVKRILREAI